MQRAVLYDVQERGGETGAVVGFIDRSATLCTFPMRLFF